jgi:hypothetical protein
MDQLIMANLYKLGLCAYIKKGEVLGLDNFNILLFY